MRRWRGYLIESYYYINPKTIKQWVWFIFSLPRAFCKLGAILLEEKRHGKKNRK